MEFTQAQEAAIQHKDGPCLVLAVPGAGKTTVLLYRLLALLDQGVPPSAICSLTFSRQQASDMRARFQTMRPNSRGLTFSTIHAFCYQIVGRWAQSQQSHLQLMASAGPWQQNRILRQLALKYRKRPLDDDEIEAFFRIDGYLKNTLTSYDQYVKATGDRFPHFQELAHDYQAFKSQHQLIDFDDMLLLTLQIFEREDQLLKGLQDRFRYIQIDEAQDTSLLQLRIIQQLAKPQDNLFMVADDDQAIYSFRGASPAGLLHFKELYPQAQIITMEANHRSSRRIVKAAGDFIRHNENRYDKRPATDKEDRHKIRIILAPDLQKEVQKLVKEAPQDLATGTSAILFRNNISMVALADQLDRAGVPFQTRARGDRFFQHPILKDLLAILHFAQDPTDLEAFTSIYYKLNAWLKKAFIQEIASMDAQMPIIDRLRCLEGTQNSFYRDQLDRIDHQFAIIRRQPVDLALEQIDAYLGYGDYLEEKSRSQARSLSTAMRIMETAKVLASQARTLPAFERRLDELPQVLAAAQKSDAPLTLTTVHGAKGLEFDTVSVIDLIQDEFPTSSATEAANAGKDFLLEEERRLFYVAMTRAKSQLKLYGRKSVNGKEVEVSQFLTELRN